MGRVAKILLIVFALPSFAFAEPCSDKMAALRVRSLDQDAVIAEALQALSPRDEKRVRKLIAQLEKSGVARADILKVISDGAGTCALR